MIRSGRFDFRPVGPADRPLVRRWLAMPHVRVWWGDPDGEETNIFEEPWTGPVDQMIVALEDRPIGYIQSYDVAIDGAGAFEGQPPGTRGVDQFLGEPDLVGRGLGSGFVAAWTDHLFAIGAPRVVTDPDPLNLAARRAYAKAGFRELGPVEMPDGTAILMIRDPHAPEPTP